MNSAVTKPIFSFAHLSDPHLTSLEDVRWQDLASKRVLGYLSWRRRRRAEHRLEVLEALRLELQRHRPDHLVITGDLTHIGLPHEFAQARHWLESLGDPSDVTVVPGNHDAYAHLDWEQGLAKWLPFMVSDDGSRAQPSTGQQDIFPSLRVRGPVAIIGLSSARPSAALLATGRLGRAQRERLAGILRRTGEAGLFRLVLIHHPPAPGMEKWRKRLTDSAELCEILGRHGAELVLHGHTHKNKQDEIEVAGRRIPVLGVPSASSVNPHDERLAQYYLYHLSKNDAGWSVNVSVECYQPQQHQFIKLREIGLEIPAHQTA